MSARQISVEDAREFWAHVSQQIGGTPDQLPEFGVVYWADGPICGAFRSGPWPGVLMADYGVKPDGWGSLISPAKSVLNAVWSEYQPKAIAGWTDGKNRAALAFNKRIGFQRVGQMMLEDGTEVIMQKWRP